MTVKEHYDNHLGQYYSWFSGDFEYNKNNFKEFCIKNKIKPFKSKYAIDLGSGHGIQTLAMAELGFFVKALDFNTHLISELKSKKAEYPIEVFEDDIKNISKYSLPQPELIICYGDTLTHLDCVDEVKTLIFDSYNILLSNGKLLLSFRDYSNELKDINRFILVKSESKRILTCFLEYYTEKLRVTDIIYEYENDKWIQKVSSYYKLRLDRDIVTIFLKKIGFKIELNSITNGIITIIGQK